MHKYIPEKNCFIGSSYRYGNIPFYLEEELGQLPAWVKEIDIETEDVERIEKKVKRRRKKAVQDQEAKDEATVTPQSGVETL